ncbi:MAG TPA: aminotransferase class V-fold PLP-dependent enzyme, partial [Bacteroidetes bacterium]|nr:aminotransferase class V-fold PLP-dependent enzyme [Bacteroidota bacterium]
MKIRLFTPGPTPVPEKVMTRMADPILHHRTKEFSNIFTEVSEILKELFQTKEDVIILTSSGTGAMEAAVANHLNPGD